MRKSRNKKLEADLEQLKRSLKQATTQINFLNKTFKTTQQIIYTMAVTLDILRDKGLITNEEIKQKINTKTEESNTNRPERSENQSIDGNSGQQLPDTTSNSGTDTISGNGIVDGTQAPAPSTMQTA